MMMYVLDESNEPIQTTDVQAWYAFFLDLERRRVALDTVDGIEVSTVFLGTPHPGGIFETCAWRGPGSAEIDLRRCDTWEQALEQHRQVVQEIKDGRI